MHEGRNVGGGGQQGNSNATKHGFYSNTYTLEELKALEAEQGAILDAEIKLVQVQLRRLITYMGNIAMEKGKDAAEVTTLMSTTFDGAKTVAALHRAKRSIEGDTGDGIAGAIAQVLTEIGTEWGIDL